MSYLHAEVQNWKVLRERLKAQFPDLDDADLLDTLEGETNAREAIVAMLRKADDDGMMVEGIAKREEELAARKSRLKARIERIRHAVLLAMEETGLRKIEEPEFTASITRKPPAVVIIDETRIPEAYWKIERKLNRKELRDALKGGADVPGADLDNGGSSLAIRRA